MDISKNMYIQPRVWPALLALALPAALGAGARDRRQLADAAGDIQHLGPPPPAEVKRVVTLAPSLTELVLALGAGERLVGVTRFDDDPRVAKLPRVGGYNDPEPETVLRLAPDLVLAQPAPENRGPVEALGRLGVPIDAYKLGTLAQIDAALRTVGARLGLAERAEALADELRVHREAVRARAPAAGTRALLVFGLEPLVVAGRGSFAGELLETTGAKNAIDQSAPFVRLSAEAAVAARPDRIILCGVEAPAGRPAIAGLVGVQTISLSSQALLHPGPRLSDALDDLVEALTQAPAGARDGGAK